MGMRRAWNLHSAQKRVLRLLVRILGEKLTHIEGDVLEAAVWRERLLLTSAISLRDNQTEK